MFLYRFEAVIQKNVVPVIIAAPDDEEAFRLVEVELEKHFLFVPEVEDLSLYEKRRLGHGGGYVLQEQETILDDSMERRGG